MIICPWHAVTSEPAFTTALGCKLTLITSTAGTEHPVSGVTVRVNNANPFAISFAEGVNIGVKEVALVNTPGTPEAPVVLVHNILFPLFTVTKFGRVKVPPHIVIWLALTMMDGFWRMVITIESVTATWGQEAIGNADIVKVTLEVSLLPKL